MMFMNMQRTRVGKLQLEVEPSQADTILSALQLAGAKHRSMERSTEALDLAAWVEHRARRRWGAAWRPVPPDGPQQAPAGRARPGAEQADQAATRRHLDAVENARLRRAHAQQAMNEWRG